MARIARDDVARETLDRIALAGARGIHARALLERDLAVALATTEGEADARDASIVVARAACAACARGDARAYVVSSERERRGSLEEEETSEIKGELLEAAAAAAADEAARRARAQVGMSESASTSANGSSVSSGLTFVATDAVRARALGIGDESTWENGLSDNARTILEAIGRARDRGVTTVELNAANKGKSVDHVVKQLAGAGLACWRKTSVRGSGKTNNVVYLTRFAPREEASREDEKTAYYTTLTTILSESPQQTATSKSVRERLNGDFQQLSLLRGKTEKAKTKIFAAAKAELCRLCFIEPVKSDMGDAIRLITPYRVLDGDGDDGADGAHDGARWTGRGIAGDLIIEQTFETQICERVRSSDGAISQADILRAYDYAPRSVEKRLLKMCDEDELFKRVSVQRGKVKTTCFTSTDAPRKRPESVETLDTEPVMNARVVDPMLVDDASRRRELLLDELRNKGFLYVNRLSKWLAVAEGGLYKTVDKKVVNALVEDVVRSGDGVAREISWSVTERVPDVILFHIDYPFDPASEEGAAFIESLKADIRSLETAERRPMSHKIASAEIVSIQPAEPLPEPAADAATPMDVDAEIDLRSTYRTLNDFHAIGLGYIKSAVVRLECLHLYLVENVFESGADDVVRRDTLDGDMPISMYIKVINSVESKKIDTQDLDHIKTEALRNKLVRDLAPGLRDKMQSTHYMAKLTQRLTALGLMREVPEYDESSQQMKLTLRLTREARFQTTATDVSDERSWSETYDVSTTAGAREFWAAMEQNFKGNPAMEKAYPATELKYPRLTAVRAWGRKWALGLDNCIILMDRLNEAWRALVMLLLAHGGASSENLISQDALKDVTDDVVAKAIECLAKFGLPTEEALRVEQLAQDINLPSDLNHIKQTWRDFIYTKICAAQSEGLITSQLAAQALNMYARFSRIGTSKRFPYRLLDASQQPDGLKTARLDRLPAVSSPTAGNANSPRYAQKTHELFMFEDDESDCEFGLPSGRKKFIFGAAEDEFLVFCMIRFISLSGPNALRAQKRDYRASVVFNDQMWRSRYPHVKKRAVVKRWRYLTTVANGDDDEDENTARHDAILRVGAEFYERGARARRETALPFVESPTSQSAMDVDTWDKTWDTTGKWSEGIAKQVLHATREILKESPVPYPLPKQPKPPRVARVRAKREVKVRRIRAGRELTEADDDIILARLAPIAFLRRRAISFQDESDDSDYEDVSDYDDSDMEEEIDVSFKDLREHKVSTHRSDALTHAQELFAADAPKRVSCVAPNGSQVLALCQALVDNKITMSTTSEEATRDVPPAFNDERVNDSPYFKSPNSAVKGLHSVKIDVRDGDGDGGKFVSAATVGTLPIAPADAKSIETKCLKLITELRAGNGVSAKEVIDELRASDAAEAVGALGASVVRCALDALTSAGKITSETIENEIVYTTRKSSSRSTEDALLGACARAVAGVALNHPGSSETRVINALGKTYPVHIIVRALRHLITDGILFERVTEKYASIVPPALGGAETGDDRNVAERFFFLADETSEKTITLLAPDFLV